MPRKAYETQNVNAWAVYNCLRVPQKEENIRLILLDELYSEYVLFCEFRKEQATTRASFSQKLTKLGFKYRRKRRNKKLIAYFEISGGSNDRIPTEMATAAARREGSLLPQGNPTFT